MDDTGDVPAGQGSARPAEPNPPDGSGAPDPPANGQRPAQAGGPEGDRPADGLELRPDATDANPMNGSADEQVGEVPPTQAQPARKDGSGGEAPGGTGSDTGEPRNGEWGEGSAGDAGSRTKPASDEPLTMARYGKMGYVGLFRHNLARPPHRGEKVIIRTERGVELGEVISEICENAQPDQLGCLSRERFNDLIVNGKQEYPYSRQNKVLRLASPQDNNDQVHLDRAGRDRIAYCRQQAAELNLKMRLVCVEHLFGGERIIFYFTSEGRIDFRELVRRLASQYRTRIEMRQIGARDEARLVGDYERCGRRCCCQQFIGTLQPVSIRMAKTQKATLDPSKISGRCGRLMCCLRFEDETYEVLRRRLPKKNTWVRTEELVARVIGADVLTQLVKVVDTHGVVATIDNDAIVERDVAHPSEPPKTVPDVPSDKNRPARSAQTGSRKSGGGRRNGQEKAASAAPKADGQGDARALPATDAAEAGEKKAPGQRRKRQRSKSARAEEPQAAASKSKKRRRRRRRGKGTDPGGQKDGNSNGPPSPG